jgi:hypothetical protein
MVKCAPSEDNSRRSTVSACITEEAILFSEVLSG